MKGSPGINKNNISNKRVLEVFLLTAYETDVSEDLSSFFKVQWVNEESM